MYSAYMWNLSSMLRCGLSMVLQHLHYLVNVVKGVVVFDKILGKL
jgi:hypothetical protein